jgi:hypothetical protein
MRLRYRFVFYETYCQLGRTVVHFPKTSDCSHLTDVDNTEHSDLTDADIGNKHTLLSGQDAQT